MTEPWMDDISNFINIYHTNFIPVFELVLPHPHHPHPHPTPTPPTPTHPFRDRKSLGTKQTQVTPNVNIGCTIELASHIQTHLSRMCWRCCWTPPHKMQMEHPHTADNFQRCGMRSGFSGKTCALHWGSYASDDLMRNWRAVTKL